MFAIQIITVLPNSDLLLFSQLVSFFLRSFCKTFKTCISTWTVGVVLVDVTFPPLPSTPPPSTTTTTTAALTCTEAMVVLLPLTILRCRQTQRLWKLLQGLIAPVQVGKENFRAGRAGHFTQVSQHLIYFRRTLGYRGRMLKYEVNHSWIWIPNFLKFGFQMLGIQMVGLRLFLCTRLTIWIPVVHTCSHLYNWT